jgi:hypothetical protein
MKIQIVHDARGRILGLGQVEPTPRGRKVKAAASLKAGTGQSVLELEITGDLAKRSFSEIYEQYGVDLKAKKLMARGGGRPPQGTE